MFSNAIVHGLDLTSRNITRVCVPPAHRASGQDPRRCYHERGDLPASGLPRRCPRRAKSYTWRGAAAGTFVEPPFLSGDD